MAKQKKTMAEQLGILKHPHVLNDDVLLKSAEFKRAMGLDLGTRTGFSMVEYLPDELPKYEKTYMGQFDLQVGDWETVTMKFIRLRQFLNFARPDVLFFEDVKQEVSINKMHMMGGIIRSVEMLGALKAHVVEWAESNDVPAHGFTIGAIKRHATGKGNANKVDMILACNEKFGSELDPEKYELTGVDNIADAAWVLDMGMATYLEGLQ
jgi:Holliday junction resolvasome RuvABC endonuclease subunit